MSGAITAGVIAGGIGAAGSVASGAIGASAAGNAASDQAQAAQYTANLNYQASQNALNFQKQQWGQSQAEIAPWLQSGYGALNALDYGLGFSPQSLPGVSLGNGAAPGATTPNGATPGGPMAPYGGNTGPGTAQPYAATDPFYNNGTTDFRNGVANGGNPSPRSGIMPLGNGGHYNTPAQPLGAGSPVSGVRQSPFYPPAGGGFGGNAAGSANPGNGFGSLLAPYPGQFTAPTGLTEQNDPGYQARLQLGTDALQRSAAASGGVLTGGTARALDQFAQDYASNEYQNVYNRDFNTYGSHYNQYEQQQANAYNRLAAMAGVGQTAAGQLGTLGQGVSNNVTSNLLGTAQSMGQAYQNAAAANASGIVGSANAYGGAIGGATGNLSNLLMLQQLFGGGGGVNWNNVAGGFNGIDTSNLG